MKYCTRCLYPDTKPDLMFNEEGVCSACTSFENRKNIDWKERENNFKLLANFYKNAGNPYNCIIPVSGGKDSHYQVIKALEYGLRPLAVTATTDHLSDIGQKNLENISRLGVDHVSVAVNAKIRRNINRYTLETIGDISWAEHVTIFTIPIREAILRKIPLIIWGENPQNEYGSPNEEAAHTHVMEKGWLQEFGGLNGLRVQDIVEAKIATAEDMDQYVFPVSFDKPLDPLFPKNIFLGQYFPWDGFENAKIATNYGFLCSYTPVQCSGFNYENLDNYQTGIHDRFKYLKFGFGRATDIVCNHIRRGLITREAGIDHINEYDGVYPSNYLDASLYDIISPLGLGIDEYNVIEEKFTNHDLFEIDDGMIIPKFKVGENVST